MGISCTSVFEKKHFSSPRKFLLAIGLLLIYSTTNGQTSITNDITINTTWNLAGSPYSIDAFGGINVATGVTLTIDPGVTVTFAGSNHDLVINGTLIADGGSGTDTIRFQDNLSSVFLSASSTGSIVDFARFETLGASNVAALHVSSDATITNSKFVDCEVGVTIAGGASPTIQDCEMVSSNDYGIRVDDGSPGITDVLIDGQNQTNSAGIWIQGGIPSIMNCTLENTGGVAAIWIDHVTAPVLSGNTFSNNVADLRTHPMLLDDTHYDNNGLSVIHVSPENITANTTWHKPQGAENWFYQMVFGDITVETGNTLTIEPGVEIVYTNNSQDLFVDGTLTAIGSVSDSIRIRDGAATIELRSGSGSSTFDYVRMEGMGAFNTAGLLIRTSDATVSNSKFVDDEVGITILSGSSPVIQDTEFFACGDYGIRVDDGSPTITNVLIDGDNGIPVGGIWIQQGSPSITNSTIQNNGNSGGIWVNTTDVPIIDNNTFTGNTRDILAHPMVLDDANFDNNGISTIYVDNDNITGNTTWHQPVLPESWNYIMTGASTVDNGATLTIEPGVDITFTSNGHDLTVNGTLDASGTASDSIRFSGGSATILLTSSSTGSMLDYVKMEQMGAFNVAGLQISSDATIDHSKFSLSEIGITINNNASPVIQNSEFFDYSDYGIRIDNGSSTISNMTIDGNGGGTGGIWIQDGTPSITSSTIQNSAGFGILIDAAVIPVIDGNSFSANTQDIIAHPEILDDENFDNNGLTVVHIDNKVVTTNTTWQIAQAPENWVYGTVGTFSVDAGVTLTIEPGVEIQFTQSSHDFTVNGTLNATGTSADSIRFNGGNASIFLSSSSTGSTLDYVKMQQMGAFNVAGLQISSDATIDHSKFSLSEIGVTINNSASPVVQNSEFFEYQDYGIRIDNGSATISNMIIDGNGGGTGGIWIQDGTPSITGSTIQNSAGFGVLIEAPVVPVIDGNSFSANTQDIIAHPEILDDENFDNNGLSSVHIDNQAVTSNTTWQAPQAPENWVYATTGLLSVDPAITLTIEPGVELQFAQSSHDFTVNGTLLAQGSAVDPISLNSGGATIFLSSSSTGSVFDYVKMEGLGAFNAAALDVSSDATVSNSIFDTCEIAISVGNSASPTIQGTLIRNSIDFGMEVSSGSPTINNSAIYDNLTGIENTGVGTVDATNNWWGDVTGPTHSSSPTGTGDEVSDNVTFTPFLLENPLEPEAPTELNLTEVSDTQIDLSWTDNSTVETGFIIERSDGNNSSFSELNTVAADVVTFNDNSVAAGNGYFYRVKAMSGVNSSDYTNTKFGSTITQPGNALQFDGVDDVVTFPEPIQAIYTDFTIEFWAKVPVTNSGQINYFVQEDPAGGGTPQIAIAGTFSNTLYFFLRESNGGLSSFVQGATLINDDVWHHFAYVREATSLRVYVDGELDGSATVFAGDIVFPNSAVGTLGGDATLDEFRFWDAVLDIDEIRSIGSASVDGTETNLSSYYRFDQDEGTDLILMDRTSNTVNGTWSDGGGGTTEPQWVASGAFSADLFPPIAVTQDISVSLDATGNANIIPSQVDNGSNDNQTAAGDLVLALDISTFDCTDIGANTVTLTVTDEGGKNSNATATVTIVDDVAPTVSAQDITATLDATGNATIVPGDVDSGNSDNCLASLSLDVTTFDCTLTGVNTVTLTATDPSGNSSNATAVVTVVDDSNPTSITQDVTVFLDASGMVSISETDIDDGSADNCPVSLSLDVSVFDCTTIGANTVSLVASDPSGNSANTTAIVTVVDDMAPTVLTQNSTVILDSDGLASITSDEIDAGTTDNCTFTLSLDITEFTSADIGANTVTLTATDGSGNVSSGTATVTVESGNSPPDFFFTYYLDENSPAGKLIGTVVATDPENDPLTYTILSGNSDDAFAIGSSSGDLTVNFQEALDFETTPVFNLVVQASDGNGGISMVSITINLNDLNEEMVTGIGDELGEVEIYPNPAYETLHVELKKINIENLTVKLYTVSGKQVLNANSVTAQDNLLEIDLRGLNAGIYLLRIQHQGVSITKNIFVK